MNILNETKPLLDCLGYIPTAASSNEKMGSTQMNRNKFGKTFLKIMEEFSKVEVKARDRAGHTAAITVDLDNTNFDSVILIFRIAEVTTCGVYIWEFESTAK